MEDYEKLGSFYLGRRYDLAKKKSNKELFLYDSKDLVTHGLVVGMTGSGKTGLCFDMIEEAAIDGVPSILIDPKGDLSNLLLTFPDLRPEDFAPWINDEDARRKGKSPADFAAEQAGVWRDGLTSWNQDGDRVRRLRAAAEFVLYTPGRTAGRPISILKSFAAPPPEVMADGEALRDRVNATVASLLGLVGINADPVKSRETILLGQLFQHAWTQGQDLDLAALIQQVQSPPVTRIGVLDLESFFPAKERFDLTMQLNNLLASPNFNAWMSGEALDIGRLLHTPEGKPRVVIFSIAHLGDAERMFFVSLLLTQMLAWMRSQSGTNSLRALLYMDEIFGYFPPIANPPSKLPLLTLLKQGRAFGLGLLLATQNPVDLDYKGLSNIGSWFIGRLQTDRDKARVLDGLEGAAAGRSARFDRSVMEQVLAGLGNRVFLLHNVHADSAEIFESRWAMSYLRGPLSRDQMKILIGSSSANEIKPSLETATARSDVPEPKTLLEASQTKRPVLPPSILQFFAPVRGAVEDQALLAYTPGLIGAAQVRYIDPKTKADFTDDVCVIAPISESAVSLDWTKAEECSVAVDDLEKTPGTGAFAPLPAAASQPKNYEKWTKSLVDWIYGERELTLYQSQLGPLSHAGEEEREFRIRLQQVAREQRDAAAEKLRQKYAPKIASLTERLRRAESAKEREAGQARHATMDTVISLGSTLLGAFLGKKALSASTMNKAATTARGIGRTVQQTGDVNRAGETVEALRAQLDDLDIEFRSEKDSLAAASDPATEAFEKIHLRPSKTNIAVRFVGLVWLPHAKQADGTLMPRF